GVIYPTCDAVLANSGHEPFGLVGLEVMAAGGLAVTGATGEDYANAYRNALVLETDDAIELVTELNLIQQRPKLAAPTGSPTRPSPSPTTAIELARDPTPTKTRPRRAAPTPPRGRTTARAYTWEKV